MDMPLGMWISICIYKGARKARIGFSRGIQSFINLKVKIILGGLSPGEGVGAKHFPPGYASYIMVVMSKIIIWGNF